MAKRRKPDVQKRLFYEVQFQLKTVEAIELEDAGDLAGARRAKAEAVKWLKKQRKEEGK